MATPTVEATNGLSDSGNATSHAVPLAVPGGGILADDIQVILAGIDGTSAITPPDGTWNELIDANIGVVPAAQAGMWWKRMSGGESGTVTFTTANEGGGWTSYCIRGAHTSTAPEVSTVSAGTLADSADPPALNPINWDVEDTLWLAVAVVNGNNNITAAPASYTNLIVNRWANANGAALGSARRANAVASEDPGAFTHAADQCGAFVIALRPRAAVTFTKTGLSIMPLVASGTGYKRELIVNGMAVIGAVSGATFAKAGSATSAFAASGADAVTFTETGLAAAPFVASGADVVTTTDTGAATMTAAASGDAAAAVAKMGLAITAFVAAGADATTFTEAGQATLVALAAGADATETADTGLAVLAAAASGTSSVEGEIARAGLAVIGALASPTFVKAGTAVSVLIASGTDAVTFTETHAPAGGLAVPYGLFSLAFPLGLEASGTSSVSAPFTKAGQAEAPLVASGADAVTFGEAGRAILAAVASGADQVVFVESGQPVLTMTAGGQDAVTFIETGAAITALAANGTASSAPPPTTTTKGLGPLLGVGS